MALTTEIRMSDFRSAAEEVALSTAPSEAVGMQAVQPNVLDSLVDTFMPSANPDQTTNLNAAPELNAAIKKSSAWKPQTQLNNSAVATGVQASNNSANAMQADAKDGLASIAAVEKDMKQQAPDAKAGASGASLAGMGRGLAFDTAVVGAVGLAAGPAAAAALGGVMLAKDLFGMATGGAGNDPRLSQGATPVTISLDRKEAREAAKNGGRIPDEAARMKSGPTNSFEAQARQAEVGYGRNNPVLEALSDGPGFGPKPKPSDITAGCDLAHDSLSGIEHIKLAKDGFQNQLHVANELTAGLDARKNNGVEVTTTAEIGNVSADLLQQSASKNTAFAPGQYA